MEKITYDKIKEFFIEQGYLATEDLIWRTYIGLEKSIGRENVGQDVYAICLDGPAGAGKSSYAKAYAKILEYYLGEKVEFITYSCNTKTGKEEVFEDIKLSAAITNDAENLISAGFIAKAIQVCNQGKKVVLRVDEYDKAKPETDSFLLEFLQEGRISSSQIGELVLEKPENLQVILCKNDFRANLSPALTRRLDFVTLKDTTPENMATIIGMRMKNHSNAIKLLVLMIYSNIYKSKEDYFRIPSSSEVMKAIDEADILTKGGASKKYIYKNIIENLLKSPVDIATFTNGNRKDGKIDEDIENFKTIFNEDSEEEFDQKALTIDLYDRYFKPMMQELKEEIKVGLKDVCKETTSFKSKSDFKLIPIEIGKKSDSKFDISSSWFEIGNLTASKETADRLVAQADEIKFDGPIYIIGDYYITIVKENLENDKVSLKFICNKPAIPTNVVIKLKEILQFIKVDDYSFAFPLVTQYGYNPLIEKQRGFYEYETSSKKQPINEIFEEIKEVKLNSIKLSTAKIIEGKNLRIENFGKGMKAVLKTSKNPQGFQIDVLSDESIEKIQEIIPIPLEKPIVISRTKGDLISYDKNTNISKIEIKSKKKGSAIVSAFEPEQVLADLNEKNLIEAEKINERLLDEINMGKQYHILKALDANQKEYLVNFIDEEKIDALNINDAISNCVDHCMANDVYVDDNIYPSLRTKTIYDILNPNIRTYGLKKNKLQNNK